METDVSVIIVNYHTAPLIVDCIESVRRHTGNVRYEIIVVDNNSGDGVAALLHSRFGDKVRVVELDDNIGFGRANNEGFRVAKGRYLFCLNPDTVLVNNALDILVRFMDSRPGAGACGANLLRADGSPNFSFKRLLPGIGWELNDLLHDLPNKMFYGKNITFNYTDHPLEVGYITGADIMLRRKALEDTGVFADDFFMYFEETDLCRRLRRAGWKIYSVPSARIIHLEGKSFCKSNPSVNEGRIEMIEKGRHIYYRRNSGKGRRMLADMIYQLFLGSRMMLCGNKTKRRIYSLRRKAFKKYRK